jgi:hypothetical protein
MGDSDDDAPEEVSLGTVRAPRCALRAQKAAITRRCARVTPLRCEFLSHPSHVSLR